jgi:glycosyltransferase involved in cell wall biosynthesis
MTNIKLSTIIPVYNKEKALRDTLQSIVDNHGIDDNLYECILVDDESTDSSPEICKEFCNKYHYFKYIRIFNDGYHIAANARNYGLDLCKGEYIHFLDADDLLCKTFYTDGVKTLDETGKDIFIRAHYYIESDGITMRTFRPFIHDLFGPTMSGSIFRNYIKQLRYIPVLSQDVIFTWMAMQGHSYYDDRDNFNSHVYRRQYREVNKRVDLSFFPKNIVQVLQDYDNYKFKLNDNNEIVWKSNGKLLTNDNLGIKK